VTTSILEQARTTRPLKRKITWSNVNLRHNVRELPRLIAVMYNSDHNLTIWRSDSLAAHQTASSGRGLSGASLRSFRTSFASHLLERGAEILSGYDLNMDKRSRSGQAIAPVGKPDSLNDAQRLHRRKDGERPSASRMRTFGMPEIFAWNRRCEMTAG
jgi:hypothetical protein